MADTCKTHTGHPHQHGAGCGHTTIQHEGHTDYLHDGHMHNVHGDHVDEHRVSVTSANPERSPDQECKAHDREHHHGAGCGHEEVPHGSHTDYLVNGHLHHQVGHQCQDHGAVQTKRAT
ncbi:MAG TPA: hypothetical protein VMU28_16435 [Terriglobales bacterium]|nr:hypothetical protein [Terriglobales bacterium]